MDASTSTSAAAPALSRRRLVQALVVGAGAVGAAAAGRASAAEPALDAGTMTLTGRGFRTTRLGAQPGKLPSEDHLPATSGELVLADGESGRFASTAVPGSGGRFVMHSFDLGDGLLLGMGSGSLREGAFAVIGGTGRYAGASGAYTAHQSPRDTGGDGSATFVFALTRREA